MNKMTLSVIMPALNEEKNIKEAIENTLKAFKNKKINGEIIVINDGSTDNTKSIIEKLMHKNLLIRLINHDTPLGIGYSFFDGVKHSKRDVVVLFSGDNENDPDTALDFFYLMQNVDIIVPFIENVELRDRMRRFISSLFRFIITFSFGITVNYTNGTVFYRRCILNNVELTSNGFFYQAELLIKLIRKGYLFAEVPNFLSKRLGGKSKAISLKSLGQVIKNYIKIFFIIHILRIEAKKDYRKLDHQSISYKKYLEKSKN